MIGSPSVLVVLQNRQKAKLTHHSSVTVQINFPQEENAQEHITTAVRNASCAPLLCECVLRAWHADREVSSGLLQRLLAALHQQRQAGQKAHVDNALQVLTSNYP